MINALLIPEPPIQILPALAEVVGFNEAAALQIIHFWLSPCVNSNFINGRHWVLNLPGQLSQRFSFWDAETIGYMVANLEQSGILMALSHPPQNSAKDSDEVTYHTINYELLKEIAPVSHVPDLPQNIPPLQKANANKPPSFTAEVQEKGDSVYVMVAQDLSHFLTCELILEIQDNECEFEIKESCSGEGNVKLKLKEVICHFPKISNSQLKELVWQDDALHGVIMILFQVKIMQQLLSFCVNHHAANLVIFADDDQAEELEIYRNFLVYREQAIIPEGKKTEMIIPANPETVGEWLDFMEITTLRLRQILWRKQKTNPAILHYLKSRDFPEF